MRDKLHVRDILSRGIVGAALAFLTTMGLPSDARAVPIVDGGSTSFTASGTNGGVPFSVTGSVTFDIIDATHVLFDFNFLNTSPNDPNVVQEDRMVTFAFDFSGITVTLNSNLATTDNDANDVWTAVLESTSNLPQFDVDVCVFSGNNCAGGGSGGLLPGESMNVGVTITGAQLPPLTFDAVYARFQSIGPTQGGSDVVQGTTTPVPEPGVLSLVGVGLVAIGLLLRRRRFSVNIAWGRGGLSARAA